MGIGFEVQEDKKIEIGIPAKVIVYNDDWHTFEEVIYQLIKALKCDLSTAEALTWEIHTKGKAVVFEGDLEEALYVQNVLEDSFCSHILA